MRYVFLIVAVLLMACAAHAQVHVGLNINVGDQPAWGPTGYDYVDYYYLPDVDAYYSVPQHLYYYNERGRWVGRRQLPSRFHNYDLYNSYKVVVNEQEPWRNHDKYRNQYGSYRGRHDQQSIRDSRDPKYYVVKGHPEHNNWEKQQKQDNGNGGGNGRGNGKGGGKKQSENNWHDNSNGKDRHGKKGH